MGIWRLLLARHLRRGKVSGFSPSRMVRRRWHDLPAHGRTRGEDAVVTSEIGSRTRYKRGEPCDEILGTEQDVCRAVPKRVLELVDHLSGGIG